MRRPEVLRSLTLAVCLACVLVPVRSHAATARSLAVASLYTCAVTTAGGVKCWGSNSYGQLGEGTTTDRWTPTDVSGLTTGVASIAAGGGQTCAVMTGGNAKCWGQNNSGQLGDGTTTNRTTPVDVSDLASGIAALTAGSDHSTNFGDGKTDLCVFRPGTDSWYVLESNTGYTTWNYFGWGASGDTLVPADYDGDGKTDGAVYRPSTGTWYVRPSSGAAQWNKVFGSPGDVPLVPIR